MPKFPSDEPEPSRPEQLCSNDLPGRLDSTPLPRDPKLSPREIHVGRDKRTGREFLLETFWSDGVAVERRLSTRPDPSATWSPPVELAGVVTGAAR